MPRPPRGACARMRRHRSEKYAPNLLRLFLPTECVGCCKASQLIFGHFTFEVDIHPQVSATLHGCWAEKRDSYLQVEADLAQPSQYPLMQQPHCHFMAQGLVAFCNLLLVEKKPALLTVAQFALVPVVIHVYLLHPSRSIPGTSEVYSGATWDPLFATSAVAAKAGCRAKRTSMEQNHPQRLSLEAVITARAPMKNAKLPPSYDGRVSWFRYEDLLRL